MRAASRLPSLALAALALLPAGCSGIRVNTDHLEGQDFSKLKTWTWLHAVQPAAGDARIDNTIFDTRVREAVEAELPARGFTKVAEGADFRVAYHAAIQQKLDVVTTTSGYRSWDRTVYDRSVIAYDEGTLVLDVIVGEGDLVWRGTATATIDPDATTEERDRRIREAVKLMLAEFPPGRTAP